jgi:hypothetical protein
MSRRQQLVRAAAQLHTAVVDAHAIVSQREAARDPACAAGGVVPSEVSEPMSKQIPSRLAWMSPLQPADPDLRFDPSVPHPARVYAYWLGGKDHYPADRHAAEEVIRRRPQAVAGARANRAFLIRVVRFLAAECGIRQFLDIGTGLPAPDNTHEVAQAITPDSCIVYVDNDPLVLFMRVPCLLVPDGDHAITWTLTCGTLERSWLVRRGRWISPGQPRFCCWRCCTSSLTPMIRWGSSPR